VAARSYLLEELAVRDNPLPVGITPPLGEAQPYALVSRPGGNVRGFLADYLIRVRVFDTDAVRLESNADLLHRLMMAANHRKIETPVGPVWITGTQSQTTPSELDDPDVPMFGYQLAVFWTIGLRAER
jgi:hypothetical protein